MTPSEAREIVLREMPSGTKIVGQTEEGEHYLFLAPFDDPLEGNLDPFFSVHKVTGHFQDFDPHTYDNSADIITRLLSQEQ